MRRLPVPSALLVAAFASISQAQTFPSKPVRVIVTIPAGGAADVIVRMVGPAKMQRPVVQRLNAEMVKVLTAPDMKPKIEEMGNFVIANSSEEFAVLMRKGSDLFGKVVANAGIKPED